MARTITPVVAAPPRLSRWFGSCRGALIKGPSSLPSSGLPAPSEAPGLLPQNSRVARSTTAVVIDEDVH
jgi:hypothetical protein